MLPESAIHFYGETSTDIFIFYQIKDLKVPLGVGNVKKINDGKLEMTSGLLSILVSLRRPES